MRSILKTFFLLLLRAFCFAQTDTMDSLKQALQNEKRDSSRVLLLTQISLTYTYSRPDTALAVAQQALALATKIRFVKGEALSLNMIGTVFFVTGNYPKALQADLESLKKAETIDDKEILVTALLAIGTDYGYNSNYLQANAYFFKSLAIAKASQNKVGIIKSLGNIGDSYEKMNMLDSALIYTGQAYDLAVQIKNLQILGTALTNLGNINTKIGRDAVAMNAYRKALPYLIQQGNDEAMCESYLGMAALFKKAGKTDSSLHYAKLSLATAQRAGFMSRVMNANYFLTGYYVSVHNTDSAFAYQSAAIAAKDSLYSQEKAREIQSLDFSETMRQQELEAAKEEARTQLKFNMLFGSLGTLLIVAFLLVRNNRHKQKANVVLQKQKLEIEEQRNQTGKALTELKATQAQLVQSEKMASLGELTAGIAHEIQNPLNFVNNFSEVNNELVEEIKNENSIDEIKAIAEDIKQNSEKILFHGKRADAIVKGMLEHSRKSEGAKTQADVNALCDEYLRLSYQGFRAKDKDFNAEIKTDFDTSVGRINIVPQDMGRVLLNLFNNAFYALNEKQKLAANGYQPTAKISTRKLNDKIEIKVEDNGNGIPENIIDKIFQPFFTTKPTGQGTGLGLSLAYDIIKAHGGEIKVKSTEREGSEFVISLPL